jgi:hypothetical protein
MLLNYDGVYWDDWVLYNQSYDTLLFLFDQSGHGFTASIGIFLSRIGNEVLPFRIYIFVGGFLSGIFLYLILDSLDAIDRFSKFFITLFFLIAPVFSQKNEMTIYP